MYDTSDPVNGIFVVVDAALFSTECRCFLILMPDAFNTLIWKSWKEVKGRKGEESLRDEIIEWSLLQLLTNKSLLRYSLSALKIMVFISVASRISC